MSSLYIKSTYSLYRLLVSFSFVQHVQVVDTLVSASIIRCLIRYLITLLFKKRDYYIHFFIGPQQATAISINIADKSQIDHGKSLVIVHKINTIKFVNI